jgi:hypothetical protein
MLFMIGIEKHEKYSFYEILGDMKYAKYNKRE